jgi:phosphatidylglycerol lysyltransferase
MAICVGYLSASAIRRAPFRIRSLELRLPLPHLAIAQLANSTADWLLAASVFYVLLPRGGPSFLIVLGAYLGAQILGLASHVPGGVGVFEGLMLLFLDPYFTSAELVSTLVVFRAVYYFAPLSVALVLLVGDEIHRRRAHAAKVTAYLGRLTERLAPKALAIFTFLGGVVLLFSGATPVAPGRLAFLSRILPLAIIETSHVVASAAGAALLLLSHGLSRRLDAAYYFTVVVMAVGLVTSLLKGGGYVEALYLAAFLLLLHRARPAFDRKAAFFATRFSPPWIAAVVAAVAAPRSCCCLLLAGCWDSLNLKPASRPMRTWMLRAALSPHRIPPGPIWFTHATRPSSSMKVVRVLSCTPFMAAPGLRWAIRWGRRIESQI